MFRYLPLLLLASPVSAQVYIDRTRVATPDWKADPATGLPAPAGTPADPIYTASSNSAAVDTYENAKVKAGAGFVVSTLTVSVATNNVLNVALTNNSTT